VPGAKSVVSLLFNYYTEKKQNADAPKVSKYAFGEDYHYVVKDKLHLFLQKINDEIGAVAGRAFVDSAPVLDKAWAKKSGLGWIGKNANLINKGHGSFFFIAELIIDLELDADGPVKDYCGTCTACIDACPTDAIVEPYVVDGSKCISYLTIELRDAIPLEFKNKMTEWAFGCDICQDVCPWNRFSKPHQESRFEASDDFLGMKKNDWVEMTEEVFTERFKKSPLSRAGYLGLIKNVRFLDSD
jgi:epoxyqueuosine reductase